MTVPIFVVQSVSRALAGAVAGPAGQGMALTAIAEALRVETRADGIHVGLVHVGYTEVEPGKTTIGEDGKNIMLDERKGFFINSSEHVAKKIAISIFKRKSTANHLPPRQNCLQCRASN